MEMIAANLANLSANGFKRSDAATQSFDVVLDGRIERRVSTRRVTNFSQGVLRPTGGVYDLALKGAGFFTVEGRDGELYTRDGRFQVDDQGVLQSLDGLPVAWEGARGTVDPKGEPVTVDQTGMLRQGTTEVGRLRVVEFERNERLVPQRGGYFRAPAELAPLPSGSLVHQGHLEQANVAAVDELVALIAVQRQFESGTRLMSTIDQSYRRLTNPR